MKTAQRADAISTRHLPSGRSLTMLLTLVVANFVLQPPTEPDFGWHVRTGLDLIQQNGRLPIHDPYSHTMPDWPWVEHAWLTDLVIGLLYSSGGVLPVILFFGGVTAAAWLIASRCCEASAPVRLFACILSLWVALPFLGARTQMVTLFGLATLMWLLFRMSKKDTHVVWWIPPLFLFWANLHGGFTAGLFYLSVVIVLSGLLGVLAPGKAARGTGLDRPMLWKLAVAAGLSGMVTFVNPYGWGLHKEILDSLSDRVMIETLREWHPISLHTLAGRMFAVYVVGLVVAMVAWYRRIEPVRWGILIIFLLLAARHLRNIPLFLIVSVPLVAELLQDVLTRVSRQPVVRNVSGPHWMAGWTFTIGLLLIVLGPDHLLRVWRFGLQPAVAFRETAYPMEAVEWIRAHRDHLGTRPIHDYQIGGFLLWWLPGEKVFIDGRMPAWRIGDRKIFQDYLAVSEGDHPALSVLDKYGVDWALLKRESVLAQNLDGLSAWRKAYEDPKVVIYAKEHTGAFDPTGHSKTGDGEASGERSRATGGSE